jgi:hypothetical protein
MPDCKQAALLIKGCVCEWPVTGGGVNTQVGCVAVKHNEF